MNQEEATKPTLKELLEAHDGIALENGVNSLLPDELASFLSDVNENDRLTIFNLLTSKLAAETFEFLDLSEQEEVLKALPNFKKASILNEIAPDTRTKFLEELPSEAVTELLKLLSPEERTVTLALLGYPEHSVGRLMTPDYIAVKQHWTVEKVLSYIRKRGKYSETINVVYIIDDAGKLIDDIRIREFLFVPPERLVSEIMDRKFIALSVNDDEESAISVFRNNDRVALPVTDTAGVLLGIVTIDDVLTLAQEEDTEDIQKMGGTEALEEPYIEIPLLTLVRKRGIWLIVLFLGEMLTATAMAFFQGEIEKAVVLALFVPLIISSGGNSGSQAATLIIRAMALGEITLQDWWRVLRRELLSGLMLGGLLGIIGFLRIALWSTFSNVYGPHWFPLGLTVGLSLVGVVMWGTISGSMLPIFLKKIGLDPAVSSAPFVATLVDVTGLLIYFSWAFILLKGTLL
ncbi:MAG: magnesium transporter [Bacteroidetes bacterium]|nr:magnesium transporter [Bacteroidota bacterium]MBK9670809.1 magnesium transporter [Bacteroidota bacterium]MBK9801145.1 magnesium transporter [Bacteroidota bacterium]MBP6411928.1 magnesium transporter [Bacteroidia bacterium]